MDALFSRLYFVGKKCQLVNINPRTVLFKVCVVRIHGTFDALTILARFS